MPVSPQISVEYPRTELSAALVGDWLLPATLSFVTTYTPESLSEGALS